MFDGRTASSVLRGAGLALAVALAAASSARGQATAFTPPGLSDAGRKAFALLAEAEFFSVGGVGYVGRPSEAEEALRVLLAEPGAAAAFKELLARANPEGRLYALLGLRLKDRAAYAAAAEAARREPATPRAGATVWDIPLKLEPGHVRVMHGCFVGTQASAEILKHLEAGRYDREFR